ncbi:hypothetical protein Dda_8230 [Drechslerella dactyloides]|uniref:Uncharacterized protein n=1 Tax=Drechslerella dactyloides TaxID=74499 RepID=A0AAD6IV32_DREDA|nr:hypothetical protein Dda_8230 [Drechslerella dactyloides]
MSLFWKRKSVAPSTDSTVPILDAPIHSDEASSLNSHPVLAASSSTQSSLNPQSKPSDSLIDFSDTPPTPFAQSSPKSGHLRSTPVAMTTASAHLDESIHLPPPDTVGGESEKTPQTPTQQKRRSFFNFGKKKPSPADDATSKPSPPTSVPPITTTPPPETKTGSATNSTTSPVSPVRSSHFGSQRRSKNTSPRLSTSSIFERNVQDSSLPPGSPSIPSHFSTEDRIPAVLEATSLTITDSSVDPDRIEIVSSAVHHTVLPHHPESISNPWAEDSAHSGDESIGHGYTSSLASADKRRLSFISFADVVQAENEQASHSSTNLETLPIKVPTQPTQQTQPQTAASLRSNSPVRTPPQLPYSPPGTGLGLSDFSMEKDMSIPDRHSGTGAATTHNEVTVETLSQALRKHGSTDLKAAAKGPASPTQNLSASVETAKKRAACVAADQSAASNRAWHKSRSFRSVRLCERQPPKPSTDDNHPTPSNRKNERTNSSSTTTSPPSSDSEYNEPSEGRKDGTTIMAIAPITGRLRRGLVMDLGIAIGGGLVCGYGWWYGYHRPTIHRRDAFYVKLEQERAAARASAS